MADAQPELSFIIVSWNVETLLRACLNSIFSTPTRHTFEVIVVDSASQDGTVAMIRREFPQVQLLAQSENVGFPRGNNIGLRAANGRYHFLLNPDTELLGAVLDPLLDYLDAHPDVGLVAPQLRNADRSVQSSRRRFPTFTLALFESTWLEPLAPPRLLERYYVLDRQDDETLSVDWVMGAAMLTRAEIFETVGGMDPGYFMYSEELDWCRRIKQAGWEIVYFPEAQVLHHLGKSSEQAATQRHINFNRAKLRYFRKYHGWGATWLLRLVLLANFTLQIGIEGVKGVLGHKRPLRWQRVNAYWQVLKSGLPPAGNHLAE